MSADEAQPVSLRIAVEADRIAEFRRKWRMTEFALFGSVLRDDFGPHSDVDVLVTFAPEAPWSLRELVDSQDELEGILGREVDLALRAGPRNPFRRHGTLTTKQVIYTEQ